LHLWFAQARGVRAGSVWRIAVAADEHRRNDDGAWLIVIASLVGLAANAPR
jgi:hypothetical protein